MNDYNHKESVKRFGENLDKLAKMFDDLKKENPIQTK